MTQTLQQLHRRIGGAVDLYGVVRTMKALAASNISQYEDAVASLRDYDHAVALGLRAVMMTAAVQPERASRRGAVVLVCGSDQGMAGQFNEALVTTLAGAMKRWGLTRPRTTLWVAGMRLAASLEDRFGPAEHLVALPTSPSGITATAQSLILAFDEWRRTNGDVSLALIYNAPTGGTAYAQNTTMLLPLDNEWLAQTRRVPWPGGSLPLHTMRGDELFTALLEEHIFIGLFRAFALSLAAENAARLATMQRAEKNIEEMLEGLRAAYNAQRQSAITEELLDVVSGFEALRSTAS